ncbi:MAG: 50S ribosomal protein L15 [Patescibacteria group bacterium]
MQIHNLKRKTKNKKHVQVGRGGKRGKTSGRGTKGQKARAGRKLYPEERDMIKKLPKLRGYRFKSFAVIPVAVNLKRIEAYYKDGEVVSMKTLEEKGIIKKKGGKWPSVKILSVGDLTKKLSFEKLKVGVSAKEKIEKAGGVIK